MKNKKGQLENTSAFLMAIIGVAFIVVIGLMILSQFKTSMIDDIATTSVSNEEITWVNATNVALNYKCLSFAAGDVTNNVTTNKTLSAGNYTLSSSGIIITDNNNDVFNITPVVLVDYTCKEQSSVAYNATSTNITKLATIPTWLGIVIVVAMAFIVLGYFYGRKN